MLFHGPTSIRVKVAAVITASIFGMGFLVYAVASTVLLRSYLELESKDVAGNVGRANDALRNAVEQLDIKLVDWAWWDDTYRFIEDRNAAYIVSNLGAGSIGNLRIRGMLFADANGQIVISKMLNAAGQEVPPTDIDAYVANHQQLLHREGLKDSLSGLVVLPEGLFFIAAEPILTSDAQGPDHGTLIFFKRFDDTVVQEIASLTHLTLHVYPSDSALTGNELSAKKMLESGKESVQFPLSGTSIAGYSLLRDINGDEAALLRVDLPRVIYAPGRETITFLILLLAAVIIAFALILLFLLDKMVLSRLSRLRQEVSKLKGGLNSVSFRVTEDSRDEIGELERAMNGLLSQISASHADLEKFKLAVENADEHVVITDVDAKILYANPSAELITGYPLPEMLGKTPALWGGQMPVPFYKKMWKTLSKDKKPFEGEFNNRRKDGSLYIAEARISPILDEKGEVRFYVGLEKDITKKRQAEAELQEYAKQLKAAKEGVELEVLKKTKELSEEKSRFLAAVNSLQLGFAIVDTEGEFLIHNPALLALVGYPKNCHSLSTLSEILGGDLDLLEKLRDCTVRHCVIDIGDLGFAGRDYRLFMTPVFSDFDGGGKPLGGVLIFEDITAAKTIDKAKTEFVSLASHQLRTPLSTINWYVEMLLSGEAGKMTKTQKTYLSEIEVGSRRMVALVNALLNVSRLELGDVGVKTAKVNPKEVIVEVVRETHAKIREQKIELSEHYEQIPSVLLDEKYFAMCIRHVFENALRYTPEGGKVDVFLKKVDAGRQIGGRTISAPSFAVVISDTGFGIPESQQDKVFTKLFRADNVLDKDEPGTGLGLFIVKSILDQTGGAIWFESKENVGTTFYIVFPLSGMISREGTKTLT